METATAILNAVGIDKSYGKVRVLKSVNFSVYPGEVHALIGENGAGKTTLINTLFGVTQPSAGQINVDGRSEVISSPIHARSLGMAMIHQEPLSFDELSVLENIFVGSLRGKTGPVVDWRKLEVEGQSILQSLGVDLDIRMKMRGLSMADRQLVDFASALVSNARIIFMDEPTASLTPDEVDKLLAIIRGLRGQGKAIVYISHRLGEVKSLSDRITVLRDGEVAGARPTADLQQSDMISLMLGRCLENCDERPAEHKQGEPYLEVREIAVPGMFRSVSFGVRKGEVFGIAGLVGSGRTEVARALFGITPVESGEIRINGRQVQIRSPREAIEHGVALLPEDRQVLGLLLTKSVAFNATFASPGKITRLRGWISRKLEAAVANRYVELLRIKARGIAQNVNELSGGNQQKVSIAKWLATDPDILILDEPSRGIDVGAKEEIHRIIRELAEAGKCVVMISSELPEILGLCDRVMVMYEGAMNALLDHGEVSEHAILAAAHDRPRI